MKSTAIKQYKIYLQFYIALLKKNKRCFNKRVHKDLT